MKPTLNTKQTFRPFLAVLCCLFIIQTAFAQTTPITLTFSGKDATTGNPVPLQSVKVSNLTQGGDTTLWGDSPTLVLQETYGIFEMNYSHNASFTLEPNFPNPFAGTTTVSIRLEDRQDLKLTMYDQQGAVAAILELELGRGTHRFEVAVPQNRIYLLSVSDGSASRTLKLFSTAGSSSRIKYLAWDENTALKTGNETTAFGFQPGDMLEYTVNAAGYYEYTTFDNPTENTDYVVDLQANTTQLPPTVSTAAVTNITATTATCGGTVTDEGSAAISARGVCWSTSPNPTTANNFTNDGAGTGAFTSNITGLTESTTYYVRAYATNSSGIAYGNEMNFTSATIIQSPPTVNTDVVTIITTTTASCGGNVSDEGSAAVTARGVCWSTSPNPTTTNSFTNDGTGTGAFTSNITGLTESTSYYVRAYASNTFGTAYGNEVSFTTTTSQELVYFCDSAINYSTIANGQQKTKFTYNANGNKILELIQIWNSVYGIWVNGWKYNFTYDASGNMLSNLYQTWNISIGNWKNNSQILFSYDNSGNLLSVLYQNWNSSIGNWVNYKQYIYTYDTSGNMLSEISKQWNSSIGNWKNIEKFIFTYDASGNRLSEMYQIWSLNNSTWVNVTQYQFTYDTIGNMLSRVFQDWNSNLGSWMNNLQFTFIYDEFGNMLSQTYQEWNSTIGSWGNTEKNIYTYDDVGNMLSDLQQEWNTSIGVWVNNWMYSYTYNNNNDMLSALYQEWNANIGGWLNQSQIVFLYDASGNMLSRTFQDWNVNYVTWVNDIKYEYQYNYTTQKITAMYYEWEAGWISIETNDMDVYLFNNNLFTGHYCHTIEVWYNSYLSETKTKGDFSGVPITLNNPNPKNSLFGYSFEEDTDGKDHNRYGMHIRGEWPDKHEYRMPCQAHPEKQIPVNDAIRRFIHSK
ncbi:MAG: DUF3836 domain-containing protein [Bacteroidales bacterium]|nr:DUF3836 domain-containing protein [Bacteroidales bacterium]